MRHTSAHKAEQLTAQEAADKAREFALLEVLVWLEMHKGNPAYAEVERAFRADWFVTVDEKGAGE